MHLQENVVMYYGVFTLTETETNSETGKNGLKRTVRRCLSLTETPMPQATMATLSVSVKYEHLHTVIGIGLCQCESFPYNKEDKT